MKVKDMSVQERPREKALRYGIEKLSNRELLAILLRTGCKGKSVLQLADEILCCSNGVVGLRYANIYDLMKIKGIHESKALHIVASLELSKRILEAEVREGMHVSSSKDIANYLMKKYGSCKQEHFVVLYLDTKHQILREKVVFIGSLDTSTVHVREILKDAFILSSAKILVAHNHPSNNCIPSEQDLLFTQTLIQVARMSGIPLLDHIIVGEDNYLSFKEQGLLE